MSNSYQTDPLLTTAGLRRAVPETVSVAMAEIHLPALRASLDRQVAAGTVGTTSHTEPVIAT